MPVKASQVLNAMACHRQYQVLRQDTSGLGRSLWACMLDHELLVLLFEIKPKPRPWCMTAVALVDQSFKNWN
jgi:hypothetical protein